MFGLHDTAGDVDRGCMDTASSLEGRRRDQRARVLERVACRRLALGGDQRDWRMPSGSRSEFDDWQVLSSLDVANDQLEIGHALDVFDAATLRDLPA